MPRRTKTPFATRLRWETRRRPLLPFLLAATLFLNLACLVGQHDEFALSNAIAQTGLIGLWLGQLRRGWEMRLCTSFFLAIAATTPFALAERADATEVGTVFAGYIVAIAVLSIVGRLMMKWANGTFGEIRFSVGGMLTASTVVACAAALLRFAELPGDGVEVVAGFGAMSLLPLVAYVIVRRVRSRWLAGFGVMGAAFFSAILFNGGVNAPDRWFGLILYQGVFIAVWLLGLRSRGRSVTRDWALDPELVSTPKAKEVELRVVAEPSAVPEETPVEKLDLNA